jgi:regulator of sigma E protease
MNIALMIILTLAMLTVLVVVHEFGHFIAARKAGVYVLEFSIGMGPLLYSHRGKETVFAVRALPIGGFCQMWGEDDADGELAEAYDLPEDLPSSRSYLNVSKRRKLLILLAGPLMNMALALVILWAVYLFNGHGFLNSIVSGTKLCVSFSGAIYQSLHQLIVGKASLNDFAGPVGMVGMVGQFARYGVLSFLLFCSLISVNLGIINLLPFPALDGGQILVTLAEMLVRRDLSPKAAMILNGIGFACLMVFSVVIAVNDVLRYLH